MQAQQEIVGDEWCESTTGNDDAWNRKLMKPETEINGIEVNRKNSNVERKKLEYWFCNEEKKNEIHIDQKVKQSKLGSANEEFIKSRRPKKV